MDMPLQRLFFDMDGRENAYAMHPDGFIDQHPDALRLTLVEGSLDRSQFSLLASDACEISRVQITATVIGASHIVTFNAGPFVLHEVFACTGLANVATWTLTDLVTLPVERQLPGMRYSFSARHVDWQDPEPSELVTLVEAARSHDKLTRIGVVQDFPVGELVVAPKTVIVGYADEDRRGLVIETAHSYPNVRGLVLSRSTLHYT